TEMLFQLKQAGHCPAGGVSGEDTLFARQAARHDRRILVRHLLELIDHVEIDVLRQEILTDALGNVGIDLVLVEDAGLLELLEHRAVGVDAPHFNARVPLFEIPPDAADGSARSDADHKMRYASFRLLPYLRTGLLIMRFGIGEIVILI